MSLAEALVVVGLVGLGVVAMGTVTSGAMRARAGVEQDVVGGYALDGFLEEAAARPGRAPPAFAPLRLGRLRWVRRWVPPGERRGELAGPLVERHVGTSQRGGARVEVRVRFDGVAPRELTGAVSLAGGS